MQGSWKRQTILFLSTQTISLFGSALVQYAISWHITLSTQSGLMATIAIVCGFLPTFFLSPFAGVWADRYDRKRLIILADAFIATATLIMALLFYAGYDSLWLLFAVLAVRALGAGIQTPAVGAILPDLVPAEHLTKVTATNGSIQSLVTLVAPMLAGALMSVASIESIFFVDVGTAAIAIFMLVAVLRIPVHAKALQEQTTSYFSDMKQGFLYIAGHDYLKAYFLFNAVFMILVAPVAFLTPLQVARTFGDDVWRLTAIEMTFSIGMMAGGLFMAWWGGFQNKIHTMMLSSLMIGVLTFLLGVVPIFWIYLVCMAIIGVAIPLFNTPATVLLQEKVEPDYLGRIFGVLGMIATSMMPLGMVIFGPVADVIRIEWLLMGTGVLMFVEGFFLIGTRVLVEAGRPASE
ncbi:MAG: transporter [Symbiobacteriaceae bacterium]|jgi:DHA3 family macrolide efflux protein-like MFS transporter|nr:transporter [Symbiobacteriaceae bacterium]